MEAQRLISVSLGKIAQSRGQRGGASLHRNLLVSTVLHKARHAFMTENFAAMMQVRTFFVILCIAGSRLESTTGRSFSCKPVKTNTKTFVNLT